MSTFTTFPEQHFVVEDLVAEGNKVALRQPEVMVTMLALLETSMS